MPSLPESACHFIGFITTTGAGRGDIIWLACIKRTRNEWEDSLRVVGSRSVSVLEESVT